MNIFEVTNQCGDLVLEGCIYRNGVVGVYAHTMGQPLHFYASMEQLPALGVDPDTDSIHYGPHDDDAYVDIDNWWQRIAKENENARS